MWNSQLQIKRNGIWIYFRGRKQILIENIYDEMCLYIYQKNYYIMKYIISLRQELIFFS